MKLSEKTLAILNNFAKHNNKILFYPGKEIKHLSEDKTVYLTANIEEEFPYQFGIFELKELLQCINMIRGAELNFIEKYIQIENDTNSIMFRHATEGCIYDVYQQSLTLSQPAFSIAVPAEQIKNMMKMSALLGANDVKVLPGEPGKLVLYDSKGTHGHTFSINAEEALENTPIKFDISTLTILEPMSYKLSYHPEKNMVRFSGVEMDVNYHLPAHRIDG